MANSFNKRNVVSTPVEFFKKVSVSIIKGLSEKVVDFNNSLEGINNKESFLNIFRKCLESLILPILSNEKLISKLDELSDEDIFFKTIYTTFILIAYKAILNLFFANSLIGNIEMFNNISSALLFEIFLAFSCGLVTGMLNTIYISNNKHLKFNKIKIFNSGKIGLLFWLGFKLKYVVLLFITIYLIVSIIHSIITTCFYKIGLL